MTSNDNGYLCAEGLEDAGKLHPNVTATPYNHGLWQAVQLPNTVGRDHMLCAFNLWHGWGTAYGDHKMVCGVVLAVNGHGVWVLKSGVTHNQFHSRLFKQRKVDAVEAVNFIIAFLGKGFEVKCVLNVKAVTFGFV